MGCLPVVSLHAAGRIRDAAAALTWPTRQLKNRSIAIVVLALLLRKKAAESRQALPIWLDQVMSAVKNLSVRQAVAMTVNVVKEASIACEGKMRIKTL